MIKASQATTKMDKNYVEDIFIMNQEKLLFVLFAVIPINVFLLLLFLVRNFLTTLCQQVVRFDMFLGHNRNLHRRVQSLQLKNVPRLLNKSNSRLYILTCFLTYIKSSGQKIKICFLKIGRPLI